MMKKFLIPVLLMFAFSANAQLNNSWIDYSKTYYKFRLAKDTLCRIPQVVLAGAGLGSTNADHFQLWRNGKQVRLYTSTTNGPLAASGFIEFWGEMNDGKPDRQLYKLPTFQQADRYSLETDTVAYFLTVNPAGGNLRFSSAVNPTLTGAADPYFLRQMDFYPRNQISYGYARVIGEYVHSSAYDIGEGWSTNSIAPCCDLFQEFRDLNFYAAAPANAFSVQVSAAGTAPNTRNLRVTIGNTDIYNSGMPFFDTANVRLSNLPTTLIENPAYVTIKVGTNSSVTTDRIVVSRIGITFPASFNFNNQKNFYFELAASATGNNLVINNFNYGNVAPVLFDMTEGRRYVGDITSNPGKVQFVLPASTVSGRQFRLVTQETNSIQSIGDLVQRQFVNFANTASQGNYVIISNRRLYNDGSGNNYVDQYRQYRSSVAGGGFNAKVYDIDELNDQFGFGVKNHPGSVRDFIRYAKQQFTVKPEYALIIGRGVDYVNQRNSEGSPLMAQLDLVPTFGAPASDILLVSEPGTVAPIVPIGRIAAINPQELKNYLTKIIQYEQAQQNTSPSINDKAWMKNVLHVVGGKDVSENTSFLSYMAGYQRIAEDSLFGGKVEVFSKSSASSVQQANSERIETLFSQGLGIIGYFGHSSANTFEFNLSNPAVYSNQGKYPFFNVSGCIAGNIFVYDPQRLTGNLALSEKYVLADQRGSIGFLADTHFGIPPFLDFYNSSLYNQFSKDMYGAGVGKQIQKVIADLGGNNPTLNYETRLHLEEINLHGDPALKINYFSKPDYAVEDQSIKISPNIISVADNNFNVAVALRNIGRAGGDSIWVSIKRQLPNDSIKVLYDKLIPPIPNTDSIYLVVPINPTSDKGLNKLIVSMDYTNRVSELYETNNNVTKEFYVFEDELRPSYPYNLSIVSQQNISFSANTANPLSGQRQYVMEIDTTENFNSAFKKTFNTSGIGGLVQFTPTGLTYTDSTVYYWRVAMIPLGTAPYIWNGFSFIYLPNSSAGFNQSHYYQHLKSTFDESIRLNPDRRFGFTDNNTSLDVSTGIYPPNDYPMSYINLGVYQLSNWGNQFNTLQFLVLDGITGTPIVNVPVGNVGAYGSNNPGSRTNQYEFPFSTLAQRNKVRDFINAMPPNAHIIMTSLILNGSANAFVSQWQNDELTEGAGNSLYGKLRGYGFTQLDSFYRNIPFIFKFNKNGSGPSFQKVASTTEEVLAASVPLTISRSEGVITSPVFGPARSWQAFHWRGTSLEANTADSVNYKIVGITPTGTEATLFSIDSTVHDLDISSINAVQYPFVKIVMKNIDSAKGTPYQLRYWRLNYQPMPEGAVAPNILFSIKDTLEQGENLNVKLAFKNISAASFDSLLRVKFVVKDRNNVDHITYAPPRKALVSGDTLTVDYTISTTAYPGLNTLLVDFNPDNHQPEQYHYNNVLYKDFYVKQDLFNPTLDVTFDGVHILNSDIVASRPNILIKLKDENRFMQLKDTALLKVQVRFPGQSQTLHTYNFGDTMRFIPATLGTGGTGENTATIEFKPYFAEDGEYELIVTGKDVVGNKAGDIEHHSSFNVINKPMISNLLNYPNPFTTSTAFVFTITGSEVPQNIRIQILTITGKVVREITKDELGPIHVGNNITEYKWDGTDMYGSKLANGVYIYRVLTNLNGKKLDKFDGRNANGDVINSNVSGTDKFFNKGYGKMYLMR